MRGLMGSVLPVALVAWLAATGESRAICLPGNEDAAEPDDACFVSPVVLRGGGTGSHNFCDDDADWTTFNACAGRSYTISTADLGPLADTVIELYGPDCTTLLDSDDNGGGGAASLLTWVAPADGVYHLKVRQANGTSGASRGYDIELTGDTSTCATWARDYRTPTRAEVLLQFVRPTADGGFVVTGLVPGGDPWDDPWVARLDERGEIVWQYSVAQDAAAGSGPAIQTADGGFLWSANLFDLDLVKFDASGNVLWERSYEHFGSVSDIEAMPDGGAVINAGEAVFRLDADGEFLWSRLYGGAVTIRDVAPTPYGGLLAAGSFRLPQKVEDVGWVTKFDGSGNVIWEKGYDVPQKTEHFAGLAPLPDGGLIVVGQAAAESTSRAVVLRLDATGDVVWQIAYGGGVAFAYGVTHSSNGSSLILSYHYETGDWQNWVQLLQLDDSGGAVWNKRRSLPDFAPGFQSPVLLPDDGLALLSGESVFFRTDASATSTAECPPLADVVAGLSDVTVTIVPVTSFSTNYIPGPGVDYPIKPETVVARWACPCIPATGTLLLQEDPARLLWSPATAAALSDVIHGDLMELHRTNGDFTAAVSAAPASCCMTNDAVAAELDDTTTAPAPGEAIFFLVRPDNTVCRTWDSFGEGLIASRDPEIALAGCACP